MHPGQVFWLLNHYPNTVEVFFHALLGAHEAEGPEGVKRLHDVLQDFAQQETARMERIKQVGEP